jgi:hypothetical protein
MEEINKNVDRIGLMLNMCPRFRKKRKLGLDNPPPPPPNPFIMG